MHNEVAEGELDYFNIPDDDWINIQGTLDTWDDRRHTTHYENP